MPVPETPEEYLKSVDALLSQEHVHKRDIFTLLYIKMEEQMRKLLVFTLRLPPHHIHYDHIAQYIDDSDIDVESCVRDITIFSGQCFNTLVGNGDFKTGKKRLKEIAALRPIRNPIFHGKMMKKEHFELFNDDAVIEQLRSWIVNVAEVTEHAFGFNGIRAMTYQKDIYATRKNYRFPKESDHSEVVQYLKEFRAEYWNGLRTTGPFRGHSS